MICDGTIIRECCELSTESDAFTEGDVFAEGEFLLADGRVYELGWRVIDEAQVEMVELRHYPLCAARTTFETRLMPAEQIRMMISAGVADVLPAALGMKRGEATAVREAHGGSAWRDGGVARNAGRHGRRVGGR
jgi:hypothetical protein